MERDPGITAMVDQQTAAMRQMMNSFQKEFEWVGDMLSRFKILSLAIEEHHRNTGSPTLEDYKLYEAYERVVNGDGPNSGQPG